MQDLVELTPHCGLPLIVSGTFVKDTKEEKQSVVLTSYKAYEPKQ